MQLCDTLPAFNVAAAVRNSKLQPEVRQAGGELLVCCNCCFVNQKNYNFCTNCGFPTHPDGDRLAKYQLWLDKRKNLQRTCFIKIEHARNALYVVAGFSMLGIFYVFSGVRQRAVTGFIMVLLGVLYAGLGRWSLRKPFTALLISLIMMLTFAVINTWVELTSMFATAATAYLLFIQTILIYFLLQGVKGAFRADVLEEEFKL